MPKAASAIATDIQTNLQQSGKDVITIPWDRFYAVADRDRIKEAFQESLAKELKKRSLLINYGNAVVLIGKDYNFAPGK
ncbi:hypothetical protein BK669_04315 [Pseudomonas fluorescens]|uniref:hypothetical protein n=1 Tax=Pseudomonas atacamensis TaxID=2565368 RepID=UPI000F46C043|nr:hypothetical protein [Pseudomonas atacamensis]MCI9875963.1 hypothetical protein [Pseudomonas atacamensis]RON65887.1 hypothetical protein BK669_04315 [Pseudomonas fluorescens]